MELPLVSIQLVVRNGERYIRRCLEAVHAQTYLNCEVVILDNASSDDTPSIVREYLNTHHWKLETSPINLGMWPGHEFLLPKTKGEYVLCLSVDVLLHPQFIVEAVAACQRDPAIAAIQGKIYQYDVRQLSTFNFQLSTFLIDTCGFALTRARKVMNIGHGESDGPAFSHARDIFGVEGAVPFFRRTALEQCRIQGHIWDPDYFWYGDDLDLAWRMTLFGHRQRFVPSAIAWHDRSTTKGTAHIPIIGQLSRLKARRTIPLMKRRLDWVNTRLTILKNDQIRNVVPHAPAILAREIATIGYMILFEPSVLTAVGRFFRLLPTILQRRRAIFSRPTLSAASMRQWFR